MSLDCLHLTLQHPLHPIQPPLHPPTRKQNSPEPARPPKPPLKRRFPPRLAAPNPAQDIPPPQDLPARRLPPTMPPRPLVRARRPPHIVGKGQRGEWEEGADRCRDSLSGIRDVV